MKKGFQWMALLVVAMLGACSGGSDKAAAEKVDEKPRVKLAEVSSRPVEQIQEYTATVEAEVKNNIAPSSPVRIDRIFVEVGDRVSKGQAGQHGCCQSEADKISVGQPADRVQAY